MWNTTFGRFIKGFKLPLTSKSYLLHGKIVVQKQLKSSSCSAVQLSIINLKNKIMAQVKSGDTVKVHYHGRLTDGTTFDSSEGRDPLEFEVGSGNVIAGFDDGVTGMSVGDKKTINIPVDQAYGPKQDDLLMEFPSDRFPEDMVPEVGMQLNMSNGAGQNFPVIIRDVREGSVILDANHPLAGEDLTFDLELVEIVGNKPLIIMP